MENENKIFEATQEIIETPVANDALQMPQKRKKGKLGAKILIIAGIIAAVGFAALIGLIILIAVLANVLGGPKIDDLVLGTEVISMNEGDNYSIGYEIFPASENDANVEWSSSDESVAEVDNYGTVTAKGSGNCTITASVGDKERYVDVTVENLLSSIYYDYCSATYATLASDGSYLKIDTNPYDWDDYYDSKAMSAIGTAIAVLDLPESLISRMGSTNALSGIQTKEYDDYTVSWSYHPDNGLEVIFEAK